MNLRQKLSSKFKPSVATVIEVYDAFLREPAKEKVAKILECKHETLNICLRKWKSLQIAKDMADEKRGSEGSFSKYVFKHLSLEAQKVWEDIEFFGDMETSSFEKINGMLSGQPKRIRQELFVHALIHSGFNISEACRQVHLPRLTLEKWKREDLEFRQLIEEIQWHKKNFFEGKLISLVEQENPAAVMFVNRTVNADRGYSEKLKIEHSGKVDAGGIDIDELDLDFETRQKILLAIRKKKELAEIEQTKQISQEAVHEA